MSFIDPFCELRDSLLDRRHTDTGPDRALAAPGLDFTLPGQNPCPQVPSVRNTPIEGTWSRWRKFQGVRLKTIVLEGEQIGVYNHEDLLHRYAYAFARVA